MTTLDEFFSGTKELILPRLQNASDGGHYYKIVDMPNQEGNRYINVEVDDCEDGFYVCVR